MPWPAAVQGALSPSQPLVARTVSLLGLPSSSDDEEFDDDSHDIRTIGGELDVARRALQDECREVEWLKVCPSLAKTLLGITDREAAKARVMDTIARAELAGE